MKVPGGAGAESGVHGQGGVGLPRGGRGWRPARRETAAARPAGQTAGPPRGVTFVTELPKTATGKIQKFVLRDGAPNVARQ